MADLAPPPPPDAFFLEALEPLDLTSAWAFFWTMISAYDDATVTCFAGVLLPPKISSNSEKLPAPSSLKLPVAMAAIRLSSIPEDAADATDAAPDTVVVLFFVAGEAARFLFAGLALPEPAFLSATFFLILTFAAGNSCGIKVMNLAGMCLCGRL